MTRHLGRLTSFPLSAYKGPVGREMRGRAVQEKVVIWFNSFMIQYTAGHDIYNYCIITLAVPNLNANSSACLSNSEIIGSEKVITKSCTWALAHA